MDKLPMTIMNYILEYVYTENIIHLSATCIYFDRRLFIRTINAYTQIPSYILSTRRFRYLRELNTNDIKWNRNCDVLARLPYLKHLTLASEILENIENNIIARYIEGITTLEYLDISSLSCSIILNTLTNLKILISYGSDGRLNNGNICSLTKIETLDISNNQYITSLNHLRSLRKLDISYRCKVDDAGLSELRLIEEIDITSNPNITSLNHLPFLRKINARFDSAITVDGIKDLKLIQELDVRGHKDAKQFKKRYKNINKLLTNWGR